MMNKINILITCINGKYVYDLINSIYSIKNMKINIFGADSNPKSKIIYIKKIYKIPRANKEKLFLKKVFSICKKEKINIIFPGSEAESILFSKYKNLFKQKKIKILVSDYKIVTSLIDKGKMFDFLEKNKINVGKWSNINSFMDLKILIKKFGYPVKKVVLKPRKGAGSRGVIILDKKIKKFKLLLENRFCGTGDIISVQKEFKRRKIMFNNLICMPYYGGNTYDVDCFAVDGKPKVIIPRLRQYENPLSEYNQGCVVEKNLKIINYIKKIIKVFKIHGPCDFDVTIDDSGNPKLLDSSNRMSGSVGASLVAGYNLPEQVIRYMCNLQIKKIIPNKKTRIVPVNKFVLV
ncbi:ATP-grasp domain-containing protein [Pelagibacteraceae bacterium]|nr:ATP-grasp domain-containing protein [Pelagibacteraceae bacterium]